MLQGGEQKWQRTVNPVTIAATERFGIAHRFKIRVLVNTLKETPKQVGSWMLKPVAESSRAFEERSSS